MAQTQVRDANALTVAVQDYAKAIYTLESRHGAASTNELAAMLEVRPASVSGMLRKLSELGLVVHFVPGHAEALDEEQLDQPVVADHLERDAAAALGEAGATVALVLDEAEL